MQIISVVTSPDQDDVIERILQSHTHNTSNPIVTIRYRYHPLAGRQFRPDRTLAGPPPVYVLQLSQGRLSVPVWMTEDWASNLRLADRPFLSVDQLLELSYFLEKTLVDLTTSSCILPQESVSEEDHEDGQTDSAQLCGRSDQRTDRSAARGPKAGRRVHGKPASSASERPGKKGGRR
jgi:hypothetical protein